MSASSMVAPSCVASDAVSGLDGTCQVTVTGGNGGATSGLYTATATATDRAGNTVTVSRQFTVTNLAPVTAAACITGPVAGTYRARFAVTNPNPVPVDVPLGASNRISGQVGAVSRPTRFAPGATTQALEVSFTSNVRWDLAGSVARADKKTTRCA